MNEIILKGKNYGLPVLIGTIVLYVLAVLGIFTGNAVIFILSILYICFGWILFLGLKVLKPQESDPVRKIHRNIEGRGILFCKSVCLRSEPGSPHPALAERRCKAGRICGY